MDLLSIASGISGLITLAESVFNVTFSYCKDVKYAQKDISRFSAQISALSGTLYRLALLCRRLESQRLQSGINHEDIHTCQKLLETIEKKLTIDENPREPKRNGFKKLLQRTTWPLTKPEVEELLSQVENMRATFDLALSAENMSTLVNMSESIVSMKKELDRRWNIETRIRLNEERNKVLKFFKPVDPSQNHQTNSQLKQEGTGLWLTKGEDFQNWLKSPNRSLWLYGIPGAGKTVLASSIIQETIQQSRKGEAVCYFYCDYRDKSRQNSRNIFGAIAAQLGVQDEQAYEILKRHYELMQKESKAYTNLTVNQILIIIKEQISAFNTCSFILDGLDECGDHIADVLDAWITMESSSQSMLRTVILSREIDLIQRRLSQESYLEISIAAQSSDIRLYVAAEIEKRTRKGSWIIEDSELNSYIMKRLVEKAQGMFRWVACQLDFIQNLADEDECRGAMEILPPTLNKTYERILENICRKPDSTQLLVERALRWILFAHGPLNIRELCEALSTYSTDHKFKLRFGETQILRHCSSLVRKSADGSRIESAHFTVKEFFETITPVSHPQLERFCLTQALAYADMSSTCLAYLNLADFRRPVPKTKEDMRKFLGEFDFHKHAANHWRHYMERATPNKLTDELIRELFSSRKVSNFLHMWRCLVWVFLDYAGDADEFEEVVSLIDDGGCSVIHWAAFLGLPNLLSDFIEKGLFNDSKSILGTPLHCAFLSFDYNTFRDVIFRRNINVQELYLDISTSALDLECISILTNSGADWNNSFSITADSTFSVLLLMVFSEHTELFNIMPSYHPLMDQAILQNLRDLHILSKKKENLVDMRPMLELFQDTMIKNDCNEDFKDFRKMHSAAHLIESDLNIEVSDINSFILSVAESGQVDLLPNLLSGQVFDMNFHHEETGCTALHFASKIGSVECVKLLLEKGALPTAKDNDEWTCLHFVAFFSGNEEVATLLLDIGMNPLQRTNAAQNSIHLAAKGNNCQIIQRIFDHQNGAMDGLNERDDSGYTPLLLAAANGADEAVNLLLPYYADSHVTDDGASLVLLAAESCGKVIIDRLIERSIDFSFHDNHGSTLLHYLVQNPNNIDATLQNIVDTDQDLVHISNNDGNTPLLKIFRIRREIEVSQQLSRTKILLEAGAKPDHCNLNGNSYFSLTLQNILSNEIFKPKLELVKLCLSRMHNSSALVKPIKNCRPLNIVLSYRGILSSHSLLRKFLNKGVDPSLRDVGINGSSGWEKACETGNLKALDAMMEKFPIPREPRPDGDSLLHITCRGSVVDKTVVERLLELGFDPNVPGKNNDLVLIMALQNQKLDIVSCLLNHGADPNKTGGRDDHPKVSQLGLNSAHWVSFYGDVNSLSQISKVPVNWNQRARPVKLIAKNGYVYTVNPHCLHLATTVGKPPHVLRFLIDLCSDDINCTTSEGYTPLHIAAFMGNLPCAKVLVERGGNIHQRDVHGNVPLHYAVQTNSESLVEYLIQCGTPLTVNNDGISPSVLASLYNQTNILEIFKRNETRGCKLNLNTQCSIGPRNPTSFDITIATLASKALDKRDTNEFKKLVTNAPRKLQLKYFPCGRCPLLHVALWQKSPDIARWLIDIGFALNKYSNCHLHGKGFSVVHIALANVMFPNDLLELLIDRADHNIWYMSPVSPIHVATLAQNKRGLETFVSLIEKRHGWDIRRIEDIVTPISKDNHDNYISKKDFIQQLYDMSKYRQRCLHISATYNQPEIAQFLLDHGADVNCVDTHLATPLHEAAQSGSLETLQLLIGRRARVNVCDFSGATSLFYAANIAEQPEECIVHLLNHKIDINIRDIFGYTALHYASGRKNAAKLIEIGCTLDIQQPFIPDWLSWILDNLAHSESLLLNSVAPLPAYAYTNHNTQLSLFCLAALWKLSTKEGRLYKYDNTPNLLSQAAISGSITSLLKMLNSKQLPNDFEVCVQEAWQASSTYGRLESIRVLLPYILAFNKMDIEPIITCWKGAQNHPHIQRWLLVERYTEQKKIELDSDTLDKDRLSVWSGPRKYEVPLIGIYAREDRSTLDNLKFVARIDKQSLMRSLERLGRLL